MPILITLLTIVEVLICLLLILIIMMQRPRQEGLGASFGSGVMDHLAGAQTTNVLQKGTSWLAGAMFITTIVLAALVSSQHPKSDKKLFQEPKATAAAEAKPAAPEAPKAPPATNGPALKLNPGGATTSPIINVQPQNAGTTTKLPNGQGTVTVKPATAPAPQAKPSEAPPAPAPDAKPAATPTPAAPTTPPATPAPAK